MFSTQIEFVTIKVQKDTGKNVNQFAQLFSYFIEKDNDVVCEGDTKADFKTGYTDLKDILQQQPELKFLGCV